MLTRRAALVQAAELLSVKGIENPWFEAQLLLANVLDTTPVDLIAYDEQVLLREDLVKFMQMVHSRCRRMPAAYILGKKNFLAWDFLVNSDVLIPRPETEEMVELSVQTLQAQFSQGDLLLADIGCGSGAIGLSMLLLLARAELIAVDISHGALQIATSNAQSLGLSTRVKFLQGNLLEPLKGNYFHCVMANLPYIPKGDYGQLQPEVKYEPMGALVSGNDGLDHYRELIPRVPDHLVPDGILFVEIGTSQGRAVYELFASAGFTHIKIEQDLAGHDRFVWGKI